MKTLHGRLIMGLLAIIIPLSVFFIYIAVTTAQQYYQEITQKLNADLAHRIFLSKPGLMLKNKVNEAEFDAAAQMLVTTNPGVEVYIIDNQGKILGSSVAMESLQRNQVSLKAIEAFLSPTMNYPIRGTDPQDASAEKIFSVVKLDEDFGYLYVILADETRDSVIRTVQNSTVLKVALWIIAVALLLVFLFGLWMFRYLTRRLRRLSSHMNAFKQSDFVVTQTLPRLEPNDEIDQLGNVFSEMSEKISEQLQGLRQVDALRRELITNVSHDLRTPLAALQGYLETMQLKASSLTEEQKQQYLTAATKHSERLGKLIKDLFDLSRFDANAVEVHPEDFLVQELAQDIMAKFEGMASERTIKLKVVADSALPFVRADIGLIERALTNLLENALKFTPSGGMVRLELHRHHNGVEVKVCDTGQGIPADDLPYVFERFYRAKGTDDKTGSGLGLAIVKRILALHQQEILVSSKPQQGTTFAFTLRWARA
jgi:two-component system, OmpR family, sensor kinase